MAKSGKAVGCKPTDYGFKTTPFLLKRVGENPVLRFYLESGSMFKNISEILFQNQRKKLEHVLAELSENDYKRSVEIEHFEDPFPLSKIMAYGYDLKRINYEINRKPKTKEEIREMVKKREQYLKKEV